VVDGIKSSREIEETISNQRMYLLAQLKSRGLSRDALHIVFTAIVLSVVAYALPSFAGQLSKGDIARIDSLFRKAFRRGFCCHTISIDELISAADNKLFRQMSNKSLPSSTASHTKKRKTNKLSQETRPQLPAATNWIHFTQGHFH